MVADDFYYAGHYLSEFDCIIVQFDDGEGGFKEATYGAEFNFTKVSLNGGRTSPLLYSEYDGQFKIDIGICKPSGSAFTPSECSNIMRWLNRPDFHEFSVVCEEWEDVRFFGSFNARQKMHRGKVIGFLLSFSSNSPFGYGAQIAKTINISAGGTSYIMNESDEIGFLYPDSVKVTLKGSGDLNLNNQLEGRSTYIKGCSNGEVITFNGNPRIISSSLSSHNIMNDFNYNFPRLYSNYDNRKNIFSSNIACTVEIKYTPVYKVVLS